MPRMRILSATEQEQFENPPTFDTFERKKFFHFPKTVLGTAKTFRKPIYQICFLISFGYFKVVKRFFSPYDFHPCDIDYVARQLDLQTDSFNAAAYANRTRQRHELIILEFYGFKRFDRTAERSIIVEIERMVQSQLKPKLAFFQCVDCMISKHIQIPNYHALSELILSALNQRKRDLSAIIDKKLTPHQRASGATFYSGGRWYSNGGISHYPQQKRCVTG